MDVVVAAVVLIGVLVLVLVLNFSGGGANAKAAPVPRTDTESRREGNSFPAMKERVDAVAKQSSLFVEASMLLVEPEIIEQETPRIGAFLYFAGAIDFLSQHYKLDEDGYLSVVYGTLRGFGVSQEGARHFCSKLPGMSLEPFGAKAMIEGGTAIQQWLSGKDKAAPVRLSELVAGWAKESIDCA